ncbi:MAG: SGNH/GDSL hydrolase family protein [Lachnospiraceae bacterium]|nr:SGNH/GDSL hydrolase family protein [Lachnospiraceae bacterium]
MKQILLLGDSLRMGYEPKVRKHLEGKAEVSGPEENGRWAGYTLNSLRFWIPGLPTPDIIHWNCGLWDLGDDYNLGRPFSLPDEYESAVERTIAVFNKLFPNAKVIMATTMPTANPDRTGIIEYNNIIKKVAKKHDIPVNDLFELVKDKVPGIVGEDTIHFTDEGFEFVGEHVAKVLEEYL